MHVDLFNYNGYFYRSFINSGYEKTSPMLRGFFLPKEAMKGKSLPPTTVGKKT